MQYEEEKGFHPIYILAVLYVASVYLFPIIYFKVSEDSASTWPLLLPCMFGVINLLAVILGKNSIGRIRLLNCAILIKYTLIPFYIIGGFCIAVALLLMISPLAIMFIIGPLVAMLFSALGWLAMLGAAPYSVGYIRQSYKQGVHGKGISVIAGICQFVFTLDVISIMILTLKEKKGIKLTITLLLIMILAMLILGVRLVIAIVQGHCARDVS